MKIRLNDGYSKVFPQANDIYKLLTLCDYLFTEKFDLEVLKKHIKVNSERQVQYYLSAGEFIGLINSEKELNEVGKLIFGQNKNTILQLVCYLILSNKIFAAYYRTRNKDTVIHMMNNYEINQSTLPRRLSSMQNWIKWCDIIVRDFDIQIIWEN